MAVKQCQLNLVDVEHCILPSFCDESLAVKRVFNARLRNKYHDWTECTGHHKIGSTNDKKLVCLFLEPYASIGISLIVYTYLITILNIIYLPTSILRFGFKTIVSITSSSHYVDTLCINKANKLQAVHVEYLFNIYVMTGLTDVVQGNSSHANDLWSHMTHHLWDKA